MTLTLVSRGVGGFSGTYPGAGKFDSLILDSTNQDVTLARLAAASLRLGAAPSATPVAQLLTLGEASRPSTDTNVAGANGTIRSGLGTGNATGSSLILQTATAVASGSTTQTYATRLTISSAALTSTVPYLAPSGTGAAPSLSFSAQPDTGLFINTSDSNRLHVASGGVDAQILGGTNVVGSTGGFGWTSAAVPVAADIDLRLFRDAAGTLAQRNGNTAQILRIYRAFTDASNYERLAIGADVANIDGVSTGFYILQQAAGTGSARPWVLGTTGAEQISFASNNEIRWQIRSDGHIFAWDDNTYDIGASNANRPRSVHLGTNVLLKVAAVGTSGVGVLGIGNGTEPSTSPADMVQLYSIDISAGNASLGLRTETAVATDAALVSTHSLTVRINGANYKVMLVSA